MNELDSTELHHCKIYSQAEKTHQLGIEPRSQLLSMSRLLYYTTKPLMHLLINTAHHPVVFRYNAGKSKYE